jgi:two-component system sensor histidine kinase ChiS
VEYTTIDHMPSLYAVMRARNKVMGQEKTHILCVDDDLDTCEMMYALLGSLGYELTWATSVAEGLKLSQRGNFDLIILDGIYPDGTGVELCQRIRSFDTQTPILFCSGKAYEADIENGIRAGAQAYLVKPLEIDNLLVEVSRYTAN